jgi:hypothetical protein
VYPWVFCGVRVVQHFLPSMATMLHLTKQILEICINLLDWNCQNMMKKDTKEVTCSRNSKGRQPNGKKKKGPYDKQRYTKYYAEN